MRKWMGQLPGRSALRSQSPVSIYCRYPPKSVEMPPLTRVFTGESCRRRKSKCDGVRPVCQPCHLAHKSCSYDADPDASPIIHIKRKYQSLQHQSADEHELLELLQSLSETCALRVLHQLRSKHGPIPALMLARELSLSSMAGKRQENLASPTASTLPSIKNPTTRQPTPEGSGYHTMPEHAAEPVRSLVPELPPLRSLW